MLEQAAKDGAQMGFVAYAVVLLANNAGDTDHVFDGHGESVLKPRNEGFSFFDQYAYEVSSSI